jgi:hypothetical protein
MAYTRQPNVVLAGTALKQNPPASTVTPPGIVPVTLDADIATTTSLGVVQVGSGLSITPAGVLSANCHGHHDDDDDERSIGGDSELLNVNLTEVNYTATLSDYYIGVTDEDVIITFPLGVTGKVYIVKNQARGNITVRGSGGQKLDSATNKTLGTEASLIAVFDGSRWNLV